MRLAALALLLLLQDAPRSTRSGVFTETQAGLGRNIYTMTCTGCHTQASHTGPQFTDKWNRLPLQRLFEYIRSSMPKSEPGVLSEREYVEVVAYLLKMNGMPAGASELPADSTALLKIRIEFGTNRDSTQPR
jgi:S-disulfanyl-L-cysteine oxidoreductase SoxD